MQDNNSFKQSQNIKIMQIYVNDRTKAIGIRLREAEIDMLRSGNLVTSECENPVRINLSKANTTGFCRENEEYNFTMSAGDCELLYKRGYFTGETSDAYKVAIQL